uniref:Mediator of RNA polymerase II transcription subunit 10 n=1 Tax=Peronospora matthiolae TaxID=2874970 RepID=A0AAV1UJK6_9STRA
MESRPKSLEDDDADVEPDQFLSDLPPPDRLELPTASSSASGLQPTPSAPLSAASEPHERRAQVGASPYLAPFTPGGSPPPFKAPVTIKGRGVNRSNSNMTTASKSGPNMTIQNNTSRTSRDVKPLKDDTATAGFMHPVLLQDDVMKHLPPRVLETLVDIVTTLDQLTNGVADFRPDQLNFLTAKATQYVELLHQADQAAAGYDADIPLQVLRNMDASEDSNPELFTKTQLEKCHEESQQAAAKVETLTMLKGALQAGLKDL